MKPALALMILPGLATAQAAQNLSGALPPSGADQVVLVEAGKRTLFMARGELWSYDQQSASTTRVAQGRIWDVTLSPKADLIAYVKGGEDRTDHFIYVVQVEASTGKPVGVERRVTSVQGDAPAISPDGRSIAFARDDSTGVGQSLVVVPLNGGKERVVAAGLPSSIRSIAWTPDGKTIFFGVNAPVPCTPEWSCLSLGESQRRLGTIRRIAASGGTVTTVVSNAQSPFPGLSPDGSTIVYRASDGSRKWNVAEADGTFRTSLSLSPSQVVQGWAGKANLLVGESSFGRGLRSLSSLDLSGRR